MPFSNFATKEKFKTHKLLGKCLLQPSCLPGNQYCHLEVSAIVSPRLTPLSSHALTPPPPPPTPQTSILSNRLMQKQSPRVFLSAYLSYRSILGTMKRYIRPPTKSTRARDKVPEEIRSLQQEEIAELWSTAAKNVSVTSSMAFARRTLRRAKHCKQEMGVMVLQIQGALTYLQSWNNPLVSLVFLVCYCRLCLMPKYIPSVAFLLVSAFLLMQYKWKISRFRNHSLKSRFHPYKAWRMGSPQEAGDRKARHNSIGAETAEGRVSEDGDSFLEDYAEESPDRETQRGATLQRGASLPTFRAAAKVLEEFGQTIGTLSGVGEKVLHLTMWTDARLTGSLVVVTGALAVTTFCFPGFLSYIFMTLGVYAMRPPFLRGKPQGNDAGKDGVFSLMMRLPDNSDCF